MNKYFKSLWRRFFIKKYLDKCIRYWRGKYKESKTREERVKAACYIDAFQSVRIFIFGKALPIEPPVSEHINCRCAIIPFIEEESGFIKEKK